MGLVGAEKRGWPCRCLESQAADCPELPVQPDHSPSWIRCLGSEGVLAAASNSASSLMAGQGHSRLGQLCAQSQHLRWGLGHVPY